MYPILFKTVKKMVFASMIKMVCNYAKNIHIKQQQLNYNQIPASRSFSKHRNPKIKQR